MENNEKPLKIIKKDCKELNVKTDHNKINGDEWNMVDIREAMESSFLTTELVKQSKNKKIVVVDTGSYEKTDFGNRLTLKVNFDGKIKTWRPNRETVENLQVYGQDSMDWLGKPFYLTVEKRNTKECIIGHPIKENVVSEEVVKDGM